MIAGQLPSSPDMLSPGSGYVDIYANKAKDLITKFGTSTPSPDLVATEGERPQRRAKA